MNQLLRALENNWNFLKAYPRVLRAAAFAPAPRPASLPLRSAKPPHSCRPGFQLVPPPENLSVPLPRSFAPATMLGLAPLALRVWASTNGRPLHSGPFRLRDKKSRPPRVPLFAPFPALSPRLAGFGFPLKDYPPPLKLQEDRLPPNPARLGSPVEAPLLNFQIRCSTPLFVLSAPRPFPLRRRPAQTLRFTNGYGNSQASRES
jgi:hypothetical protein